MNSNLVFDYLETLIPNPVCELEYKKDYELLIAVMLSAQTTDKRVNIVTKIMFSKYDSIDKLANADLDDITNLVRSLGTYSKKAKNVIDIAKSLKQNGFITVPNDRLYLESLPGVGRKTANVFLGEIYKVPCIAVDTHVARVAKRLKFAKESDSVEVIEKKLSKVIKEDDMVKRHHQLLLFGRYYCKAIKPLCKDCKLKDICIEKRKSI